MRDPSKGHAALRRGRVSIPHAEYFVTICTDQRRVDLTAPDVATLVLAEMSAMTADASWQMRCAVVMPDHIHVLFILGERLTLGKCLARLKAKTSPVLAAFTSALMWERDFFDRHIRAEEDRLSLFQYIFLSPYRAGLCERTDRWPWYFCREEDWVWFAPLLDQDRPVPEWLAD